MGVNGRSTGFVIRTDTFHITPEILGLIAGIEEFKGAWRALGALATLKQHFRSLVEKGHLKLHGSGRGVWYELR